MSRAVWFTIKERDYKPFAFSTQVFAFERSKILVSQSKNELLRLFEAKNVFLLRLQGALLCQFLAGSCRSNFGIVPRETLIIKFVEMTLTSRMANLIFKFNLCTNETLKVFSIISVKFFRISCFD